MITPTRKSSDTIGTKGWSHWQARTFKEAMIDALAMNLNDLLLVRATAVDVHDVIMVPKDDREAILQLLDALVHECMMRQIIVSGGETAVLNTLQGMEIALFAIGHEWSPKPNRFCAGDVLIGLRSSGLHASGFTRVYELLGDEVREEFVEPTALYTRAVMRADSLYGINGMMHITGGAFTKLLDSAVAPRDVDFLITHDGASRPHDIFYELYEQGVSDEEMYRTFNCGVGFILSTCSQDAERIVREIGVHEAAIIGGVVPGSGRVVIDSQFSSATVVYD